MKTVFDVARDSAQVEEDIEKYGAAVVIFDTKFPIQGQVIVAITPVTEEKEFVFLGEYEYEADFMPEGGTRTRRRRGVSHDVNGILALVYHAHHAI